MGQNYYTSFSCVYQSFFSKITDDMYENMEFTEEQTAAMAQDLLLTAIQKFEFPRTPLIYQLNHHIQVDENDNSYMVGAFKGRLNAEQINILATYMIVQWIGQQLASIQLTRMKYSGADFKFTSQANHMQKLLQMKKDYEREGFHLQRLYKRRVRDTNGIYRSTFGDIMKAPSDYTSGYGSDLDNYPDNIIDGDDDDDGWISNGVAWHPYVQGG